MIALFNTLERLAAGVEVVRNLSLQLRCAPWVEAAVAGPPVGGGQACGRGGGVLKSKTNTCLLPPSKPAAAATAARTPAAWARSKM